MTGEAIEDRYWEKVDKSGPDECWEWTATTNPQGYGMIHYNGGNELAHRIAVKIFGEGLTQDQQVNHKCDNSLCVNPDHLYIGTQSENIQDAYDRGRKTPPNNGGGGPKLSKREVAEIKSRTDVPQTKLAEEYGVSEGQISRIINGHDWADVKPLNG